MLNPHDFWSWSVILPALLAGGAAAMSWRGAHISGDKEKINVLMWGLGSALVFLVALTVGAISNHEGAEALQKANARADASDGKLSRIQVSVADLKTQNSKLLENLSLIAAKVSVDPNQSAQELSSQVVAKLSELQNELNNTNSHVSVLENPPPDPNTLYQNGKAVGRVIKGSIDTSKRIVTLTEVDDATNVDFASPISLREFIISCSPKPFSFLMGTSPITGKLATNVLENVACRVSN